MSMPKSPVAVKTMRLCQIGVGGHGISHLRVMESLKEEGLFRLVAVADPFEDRLPELSAEMRGAGVPWFGDYREMLRKGPDTDLVIISTPIALHEEMTLEALQSTRARILLEKPAVPTVAQLDRLIASDPSRRVRVGYQMLHWPEVQALRRWISEGGLGAPRQVTVTAGWPRDDAYYRRSPWAGRMCQDGRMVYDGPATNALSHLLCLVCFLLGGEGAFARPKDVRGWLARARDIESYDTVYTACSVGETTVRVLLTHAVAEKVPFRIEVEGTETTATLDEDAPRLSRGDRGPWTGPAAGPSDKQPLYRRMAADAETFAAMPGTPWDLRGLTAWTEELRLAGPVRQIDPGLIRRTENGVAAVRGMEEALRSFRSTGAEPAALLVSP